MPPWVRKYLSPVWKYAFGALALFMLIRSEALDPHKILAALRHSKGPLAAAFALYLMVNICAALRWWVLLKTARVEESAARVFRLHMVGVFFSGLLPGGTAGDLAKGYYLFRKEDGQASARAVASLVMDRLTGMLGLLSLALAAGWSQLSLWRDIQPLQALEILLFLILAGMCGVLSLALHADSPRLGPLVQSMRKWPGGGFLSDTLRSLAVYKGQTHVLIFAWLLSVVTHSFLVGVYIACALALGIGLEWHIHFLATPLCTLLNGVPISPAGLGVGEAFGNWLYGQLGIGAGGELLAMVHLCVFATAAVCSVAYVFERRR